MTQSFRDAFASKILPYVKVVMHLSFFSPSATLSEPDNSTDLDPSIDPANLKMYDQEMEGER